LDFIIVWLEVIAWSGRATVSFQDNKDWLKAHGLQNLQLEESIRNLQHQNVWMIMFMAYQNTFASSPHAILLIMFL
jgi:hypothetical protein